MADHQLSRSDRSILVGALVVATFLVSFGALHYGVFTKKVLLDTPLYERYGDALVHGGKIPYRDFALEYPPGALAAFSVPSLVAARGDFPLYARLFEGLMLLCGAAAAGLVAFILTRDGAGPVRLVGGTLLAGLAPLALGPVVLSRFDLWPAALTVAAVAALIADRPRAAFALLGGAVATKVYPIVLVPPAVAYVWRRKGRREAAIGCGVLLAVVAALFVPFLALSPSGVWASFSGQASRPLQIESLGASFLLAAHQAWGLSLDELSSHGSDNLGGSAAHTLAVAQSLLELAVLGVLWVAFARGEATRDRLIRYTAATVCAFVALNKVLSPQYLIWLFALIPLVRGRRGAVAGALFLAAMVLTQLWFPRHYIALVYGLDPRASWFVVARDMTLVALLAALVWPAHRAPRPAVAVVGMLAAAAAAAATVGAVTSVPAGVARHSGLLTETGRASRCGTSRAAPGLSGGTVAYEVARFRLPRGAGCVTVTLTAPPRVELFSTAYRRGFDPADPRAGYIGDAGRCTNVAGLSGPRVGYSFAAASVSSVAVEVENCGPGGVVPAYVLDVHDSVAAPVVYRSAAATRRGGLVTVRWATSKEPAGSTFRVYRQQGATMVAASTKPLAGRGASGGAYVFADRAAPLVRPLRYWLQTESPNGRWSWYGPVPSNG